MSQENFSQNTGEREADKLVETSAKGFSGRFALVAKKQIAVWKALLIVVFAAGFTAAIVWTVSFDRGVPSEAAVPSERYNCQPGAFMGDANGNGKISEVDHQIVLAILAYKLPYPKNICCVDMNQDGNLTGSDALYIAQIIAGGKQSPGRCK